MEYIGHSLPQPVAAKLKPPGLRKEDPPLGTGAPKPTKQLSVSSSFGFRPESHAPESQTKRHPGSNTSVVRHPEPPPSYQFGSGDPATKRNHQATKPKQLVRRAQHHEVIPDSEEEVTEGGGQDNYEGDEEGGDNDECGSQFSLDTQARLEMGMDPDANEDDEEMQVDHRGLNVQGGDANDYQDAYQDSNAEYDNINEDFQGSQPGEGVLHQGGRFCEFFKLMMLSSPFIYFKAPRDIDEHSPDEDERHAMNVLQSLPQHNNGKLFIVHLFSLKYMEAREQIAAHPLRNIPFYKPTNAKTAGAVHQTLRHWLLLLLPNAHPPPSSNGFGRLKNPMWIAIILTRARHLLMSTQLRESAHLAIQGLTMIIYQSPHKSAITQVHGSTFSKPRKMSTVFIFTASQTTPFLNVMQ